ncbi:hypothetical protein EDB19DRAFT_1100869 [Suillus lakei]|nr:hypothetical protein EDB19DRAFT_1100869 [Suillus lakei]
MKVVLWLGLAQLPVDWMRTLYMVSMCNVHIQSSLGMMARLIQATKLRTAKASVPAGAGVLGAWRAQRLIPRLSWRQWHRLLILSVAHIPVHCPIPPALFSSLK